MNAVRVPWSSAAFLVYLGGLVILAAILALLNVQSSEHGDFGLVFWAALLFAVLAGLASGFKRSGHFVTAGLFALSAVAAFIVFVGAVLEWFGWLPNTDHPFRGFRFWLLFLELLTIVSAAVALRIFRFPLLVFVVAAASWFFVTDLLSGGGDWSAIVTIAFGVVLLLIAVSVDAGSRVRGFWLHVVAGLTIGGGLLWFFNDGGFDWILIAVVGLLYIALADRLVRSSWAVLGAWGILQTASHFADKWSSIAEGFFPVFYLFPFVLSFDGFGEEHEHEWAGPLTFAVTGLVFIGIALFLARRHRDEIPAADIL
jgi:hypothetical protein